MKDSNSNIQSSQLDSKYPVRMIPFDKSSLEKLYNELIFADVVGTKKAYYNIPSAFDTEASSFEDEQGNECALLYVWMFGIGNTVVYSRDIDEFPVLVRKLSDFCKAYNVRLITYVHFLKYDFSFIKKLVKWDDIFLRSNREPLYVRYGNFEMRDSLALSGGRGLAYIGKTLRRPVYKAVGDLDYDKIRTPETPLTLPEMHYCEMDIRVLLEYIQEKIEDDGGINKIPLTNTGYVRNYVRDACFQNRGRYMNFIDGLTMTPDCYLQAEKAFMGGAVGPNIRKVSSQLDNVHSYDIKSSYPYVMCTGYYPMQYGIPVSEDIANKNLEDLLSRYCCLFTLEAYDMTPKTDNVFPLSEHKCKAAMERTASGRIIQAMYINTNCTELDFDTYRKFYNFGNFHVSRFRIFPRGYLPSEIVMSVLKFFHDKTTLDGVKGKEKEYMISKNMLNSVYGMMVEKIVRELYSYQIDTDFTKQDGDYVKQVLEYNEKRNRFLFYPWGVWVTAHARHRLYDAIYAVGDDFVYCDTDSVKFTGEHTTYFERVNNEARQEIVKLAKRLRIPIEQAAPYSPSGAQKWLGVWENEWTAKRFKTIGAKRYLLEKQDGTLELTVAGTNKKSTLEYMKQQASQLDTDIFDLFNEDLYIPPEYAKRTVSKFIDDFRSGYVTDYTGARHYFQSPSGVYIKPSGYSFSITDEMVEAILYLTHDGHYTESDL